MTAIKKTTMSYLSSMRNCDILSCCFWKVGVIRAEDEKAGESSPSESRIWSEDTIVVAKE